MRISGEIHKADGAKKLRALHARQPSSYRGAVRNVPYALQTWRSRLMSAGYGIKLAFAALLFIVGMLILTGYDKRIETMLIQASPDWLTNLTTRF